jgi:hypothetical protein
MKNPNGKKAKAKKARKAIVKAKTPVARKEKAPRAMPVEGGFDKVNYQKIYMRDLRAAKKAGFAGVKAYRESMAK